jgi:hypothetical protein
LIAPTACCVAELYLYLRQARLQLRQRDIRLFRYELLDQISVRRKRKCLVAAKFGWANRANPLGTARRDGALLDLGRHASAYETLMLPTAILPVRRSS